MFAIGAGIVAWGGISLRPDVIYAGIAVLGLPLVIRGQERSNGR